MKYSKSKIYSRSRFLDTKAVCLGIYGMWNPVFTCFSLKEWLPPLILNFRVHGPLKCMHLFLVLSHSLLHFQHPNTIMCGTRCAHTNISTLIYITFLQMHTSSHSAPDAVWIIQPITRLSDLSRVPDCDMLRSLKNPSRYAWLTRVRTQVCAKPSMKHEISFILISYFLTRRYDRGGTISGNWKWF